MEGISDLDNKTDKLIGRNQGGLTFMYSKLTIFQASEGEMCE
jgi:hypothetical protein